MSAHTTVTWTPAVGAEMPDCALLITSPGDVRELRMSIPEQPHERSLWLIDHATGDVWTAPLATLVGDFDVAAKEHPRHPPSHRGKK